MSDTIDDRMRQVRQWISKMENSVDDATSATYRAGKLDQGYVSEFIQDLEIVKAKIVALQELINNK